MENIFLLLAGKDKALRSFWDLKIWIWIWILRVILFFSILKTVEYLYFLLMEILSVPLGWAFLPLKALLTQIATSMSIKRDHPRRPFVAPDGTIFMNFTFIGLSISPENLIFNAGIFYEIPRDWAEKCDKIVANLYSNTFIDIISLDGERMVRLLCPGLVGAGVLILKVFIMRSKRRTLVIIGLLNIS